MSEIQNVISELPIYFIVVSTYSIRNWSREKQISHAIYIGWECDTAIHRPWAILRYFVMVSRPFHNYIMMTSSNGNIFRVTGLLCVEFTGHRWIPRTKASDAELWCFLWFDLRLNNQLSWVNNREAGDLRRHQAHYDVIVMILGMMGARQTK